MVPHHPLPSRLSRARRYAVGCAPATPTKPSRGSGGFPEGRDALAYPDAHGRCRAAAAPTAQLVQERGGDPGSGTAQRMADGDRAAVDVDQVFVELELF